MADPVTLAVSLPVLLGTLVLFVYAAHTVISDLRADPEPCWRCRGTGNDPALYWRTGVEGCDCDSAGRF